MRREETSENVSTNLISNPILELILVRAVSCYLRDLFSR